MASRWFDLSKLLRHQTVRASAPVRIDCGGGTDQLLIGSLCRQWQPTTVNIALDVRTTVILKPYEPGKILIEARGLGKQELIPSKSPFTGPLGLMFAVLTHFGVHGVHLVTDSEAPLHGGLGGSGTVCVAAIGALAAILPEAREARYARPDIVLLAHNIEHSLFGNTGLQDQAAAVYGGIHRWQWQFDGRLDFARYRLTVDPDVIEKHIAVAYMGQPHPLSRGGSGTVQRFKESGNVEMFVEISRQAEVFAAAIEAEQFDLAARALLVESELRAQLIPQVLPEEDEILLTVARESGCGAKVTGRGEGGSIWAIGPEEAIRHVKDEWQDTFERRGSGRLLPTSIAAEGLQVAIE